MRKHKSTEFPARRGRDIFGKCPKMLPARVVCLKRAASAIDLVPAAERDISALTLCVGEAGLAQLKQRLQALRRELLELNEDEAERCQVVQLNLQLFPLSNSGDANAVPRAKRCQLIEPNARPTPDCSSDFDRGTGEALNIPVYWYYPQGGVCLLKAYGGVGGNDNRYDSREACETACSRAGECPPSRVEATICVDSEPAGGCARTATACALLCSEPGLPCAGEPYGWYCNDQLRCEATLAEVARTEWDCSSDFDPGTGDALFPVYWYDPQGQVCLPRSWGGLSGNANRFASLEACETQCKVAGRECPPNRIQMEVCVEPAPIAGCSRTANACALACSTHDQCAGQPIGPFCLDGGCQSYSPF